MPVAAVNFTEYGVAFRCFPVFFLFQVGGKNSLYFFFYFTLGHWGDA